MIDGKMKKALMSDVNRIVEIHKREGADWFIPEEKYEGELRHIARSTNEVIKQGRGVWAEVWESNGCQEGINGLPDSGRVPRSRAVGEGKRGKQPDNVLRFNAGTTRSSGIPAETADRACVHGGVVVLLE